MRFLNQRETAEALRVSPRSLERWRVSGFGPRFVKAGRRVLYSEQEVEAWASARSVQSTSEVRS
jgi:hypothetical protein